MKAVRVTQWGGPQAAVIEDLDRPQPAAGEVLVRVKATAINPIDWKIREGYLGEYVALPYMLGSDIAGDIEAVGPGVTDLDVGTPVYGLKGLRGGGFAEYTTVPAGEVAPKPTTLSYAEAAAVPHAAMTAWHCLMDLAQLQPGQRVLIHAAAGGVGHFAVQIAKRCGAYVIGTASAGNEAFVRSLGADEFVDYRAAPFETVVQDVDVVLDAVGFDTSERSCQVIKPGGMLICIVTPPPFEAAAQRNVQAHYAAMQANRAQLTELARLIDSGHLKPHIQQILPFEQIHEALNISQGQHVRGKLAVTVVQ